VEKTGTEGSYADSYSQEFIDVTNIMTSMCGKTGYDEMDNEQY